MIGTRTSDKIKTARILRELTTPNSIKFSLLVRMNAAKPNAVVVFVISAMYPTLLTTR